jgi:hypothetical protein
MALKGLNPEKGEPAKNQPKHHEEQTCSHQQRHNNFLACGPKVGQFSLCLLLSRFRLHCGYFSLEPKAIHN